MSGLADLDPLSIFALEDESIKKENIKAPKRGVMDRVGSMVSGVFNEAHALANKNLSQKQGQRPYHAVGSSSANSTSVQANTAGTLPPKRNIFQDEDPAAKALNLRRQQIIASQPPPVALHTEAKPVPTTAPPQHSVSTPVSVSTSAPSSSDTLQAFSAADSPKKGNIGGSDLNCLLTGEQTLMSLKDSFLQVTVDRFMPGILYMTNYRTIFEPSASHLAALAVHNPAIHSWLSVPLACIDRVEKVRGSTGPAQSDVMIHIRCKDLREHKIAIKNKQGNEFELMHSEDVPVEPLQPFDMVRDDSIPDAARKTPCFPWRLCHANISFAVCNTYPQVLVMPNTLSDEEVFTISKFRSGQRLPAMTWGSKKTGATIAMANKATGAGYESQTNYPHCRLEFYNIGNIHVMRDSLKSIYNIILAPSPNSGDVSFGKSFEDTGWLTHVRLVIKASYETAAFLQKGEPVLVHCSHGWDRTAQVCALAQIFIDSRYRTIDGFRSLVEKDWFAFGHAFGMRCGHGQDKATRQDDQISPIFLQFLDCVWQLIRQYPHLFEFNSRYILTLADQIYSGRFGTFLFSCDQEREEMNALRIPDVWTYLSANRNKFVNPLYVNADGPFLPHLSRILRNVIPWSDYFFRWAVVPSQVVPPPEYANNLYHKGTCLNPEVKMLGAASETSNDLAISAVVNHDNVWEGMWTQDRRVKDFSLKQVEDLTALLRAKGVDEEDIAGCLAGTYRADAERKADAPAFVIESEDDESGSEKDDAVTKNVAETSDAGDADDHVAEDHVADDNDDLNEEDGGSSERE
eukprot:GSChrysophyteH1.ASY1.ANO1.2829.1 assembled CDS